MPPIAAQLAQSVDDAFLLAAKRRMVCRHRREPDTFDGREFSLAEFAATHAPALSCPADFYRDFRPPEGLALREGVHPGQRRRPVVPLRQMLFDSPLPTPWAENNLVPFKWVANPSALSESLLLMVPGWGRTCQTVEERWADRLRRAGVDVGIVTKPYHQARAPAGAFSGEYWISANVFWTIANFRQLTAELRLLIQHMRRYYRRVGIIGVSSGGVQAVLAASCEPLDYLFLVITGGRLGSVAWHSGSTRYIRRELETRGIDEEALNRVWAICDGTIIGRHSQAMYVKQYIAAYDRVVPTEYQYGLWEALGRPDQCELPCGHFSINLFGRRVIDDVANIVTGRAPGI